MSAGRTINTGSQHWGTPQKYVKAMREVFQGDIDLDPCSNRLLSKVVKKANLPKNTL
jgi:hypothetical protein